MKTENTMPLYKRLNSERTQGEWQSSKMQYINGQHFILESQKSHNWIGEFGLAEQHPAYIGDNPVIAERNANAEYTALAVNNLNEIAEALELLANEINLSKLNIRKDFSLINAHATALKALNKIS